MRIAQIAPLWEYVPPRTYGGTELVVHLLTEEMVRRGHEVTLFAVAGSQTQADLVACCPRPLREMDEDLVKDKTHCTVMGYELGLLQSVFSRAEDFDIIHNHVGYQALPFADFVKTPMVSTLHNALDPQPVKDIFFKNRHLSYISISDYQQALWPELNYAATIHHGINLKRFKPCYDQNGEKYLAFLGRLSPEKGPVQAIQAAKALGLPLKLAGKIDRVDRLYYEHEIARLVDGEQIQYVGELNHEQKVEFLRNAVATLCPVQWPEPFGLVMIESMACGTPVFALRNGSTPEVIDQGVTGYVTDNMEALIDALRNYARYDRRKVRRVAEDRFSVQRMVDDHLDLYARLIVQAKSNINHIEMMISDGIPASIAGTSLTPSQVACIKHNAASRKPPMPRPSKSRLSNGLEVPQADLEPVFQDLTDALYGP